ncbi:MAG: hypothetical protein ACI8X3_003242, partial [Saprospiraceae bacterium]
MQKTYTYEMAKKTWCSPIGFDCSTSGFVFYLQRTQT